MKTSRFEKTLRQKLESIQPEFKDQDWTKMQSYQQLHAPQTFWQTYGHWIGYTAAALTTAVMVVLYVHTSSQNDQLLKELNNLKEQVATQKETPPATAPAIRDTIYVIQRQEIITQQPFLVEVPGTQTIEELAPNNNPEIATELQPTGVSEQQGNTPATVPKGQSSGQSEVLPGKTEGEEPLSKVQDGVRNNSREVTSRIGEENRTTSPSVGSARDVVRPNIEKSNPANQPSDGAVTPPIDGSRESAELAAPNQEPVRMVAVSPLSSQPPVFENRTYQRRLLNRMPRVATTGKETEKTRQVTSVAKVEKTQKSERLLPDFNLNLPYRVGLGQQWEGRMNAFSVWNEVLLNEHWAVQTGLSWKKLENQKYFSEINFREIKKQDFRKENAPRLPPNFKIFNIVTATTLTQIPLNLVYRDAISNDFSFFVGTGTNLNLRAKQVTTFDFERPTRDFGQDAKQRYATIPLVNSFQVLAGVEKRWNPIVLQVDSYVTRRIKTMSFLPDRTSVGLRVKLLYEFGRDKKN